jgi:hypothetical protein
MRITSTHFIVALACVVLYMLYRSQKAQALPVYAPPVAKPIVPVTNAKGALLQKTSLPAKMLPPPPKAKPKKKSFWGKIGGGLKSVGKTGLSSVKTIGKDVYAVNKAASTKALTSYYSGGRAI